MDFGQTWHILSPEENREPYWISRSYVKGQGHRVKFLGEGIRHALRCPCFYFRWCLCRQIVIWPVFSGVYVAKSFGFHVVFSRYLSVFVGPLHCLPFFNIRLQISSLASWKCSHFSYFALLYIYIYSSIFNCPWLYCLTLYSVCLTTRTVSSNSFYCYQYAYLKC
jgi:hypothetical protein